MRYSVACGGFVGALLENTLAAPNINFNSSGNFSDTEKNSACVSYLVRCHPVFLANTRAIP